MAQARRLGLSYYGFGRFGRKVNGENKVLYHSKGGQLVKAQLNEDLRKWFREKWVRFDTKGNIKGDCAREPGEGKPKCRPLASARAMGKEERAKSARRKRREDPVATRPGKGHKPINVKTESVQPAIDKINRDRMSEQVLMEKNKPTNPELWARAKSMAKQKFDVYPSAYANGWAAKWYKSKGGGWQSVNEGQEDVKMSKKQKVKRKLASVDESFEDFMSKSSNRETGTNSLAAIYKKMTPGQEVAEDNNLPRGGLPKSDGIGPEYGIQISPALVSGFTNIGNAVYETSKSIQSWAKDPKTQEKFAKKYGKLAEEKLIEAALRLEQSGCGTDMVKPKSVKKIKEAASYGKDPADTLSPIGNQNKDSVNELSLKAYKKKIDFRSTQEKKHASLMDEKQPITPIKASIAEAIDKAKMKCNKPRAEPVGDSLTGKSHVVKACAGGQEKIIRFGQRGVKGSPKKEGESKAYANRRKRFKARHAKNIKKGKMSAAYWANKVRGKLKC